MPDITFETRGFAQLERNWLELANQLGPRRARTLANIPLRNAMRIVESDIRNNVPVDTGGLRDSVALRVGSLTRRELRGGANQNIVAAARAGYFWRGRSLWFQATNTEYGNSRQAPNPVIRNALQNNARTVLSTFGQEFGRRLERRATQLAQRGR